MAPSVANDSTTIDLDSDALLRTEDGMEAHFLEDVGTEVRLVDVASTLLVWTLAAVHPSTAQGVIDTRGELVTTAEPEKLILGANVLLGGRAVRVIRAARAVLARGFEGEARALDRILVELMAHRRAILDDKTGREALGWLQRKRTSRISARVAAMGDKELYANLCTDAHGDPAPVLRLQRAEADNTIELGPHRTNATRASLLMYAGFARDQAVLVSRLSGATVITSLDELDAEIDAAWVRVKEEEQNRTATLDRRPPPVG